MKPTLAIAFTVLAAGCASDQHVYNSQEDCITCFNNPITGTAINHDNGTTAERQARIDTRIAESSDHEQISEQLRLTRTLPVDVDVAFAKFSRAWNIQSPEDLADRHGQVAAKWMQEDRGYKYDVLPSVTYDIKQIMTGDGYRIHYALILEKAGDEETFMDLQYVVVGPIDDPEALMTAELAHAIPSEVADR